MANLGILDKLGDNDFWEANVPDTGVIDKLASSKRAVRLGTSKDGILLREHTREMWEDAWTRFYIDYPHATPGNILVSRDQFIPMLVVASAHGGIEYRSGDPERLRRGNLATAFKINVWSEAWFPAAFRPRWVGVAMLIAKGEEL